MIFLRIFLGHRRAFFQPCAALTGILLLCPLPSEAGSSPASRFQGCPANGQTGPVPAPTLSHFTLPAPLPKGLALYASQDLTAVAPAGWHCLELYGSSGAFLMLKPDAFPQTDSTLEVRISGPGIQVSSTSGTTSGRFDVARTIARAFPTHQPFVQSVIQEGIEPASRFPTGPYPDDQITREGDRDIAFVTPAHTVGFGTESRLTANNTPIKGVIHLTSAQDLMTIHVRLASNQSHLTQTIIDQTRKLNADFAR